MITEGQLAVIVGTFLAIACFVVLATDLRTYRRELYAWHHRARQYRMPSEEELGAALSGIASLETSADHPKFTIELPPIREPQRIVVDPFDEYSIKKLVEAMRERANAVTSTESP